MEDKAYIIIDDEDQRTRMKQKIDDILRPDGYNIKAFFFNPTDKKYWDDNLEFDINKFIQDLREKTRSYHINVTACDYQFSGTNYNGVKLVKALRDNDFRFPIILYTANDQIVIRDLFMESKDETVLMENFLMLLKCKIELFLKRDTYPDALVERLKKSYNIKDIVLKKLAENPDVTIRYDANFFDGKKISAAIHEIAQDSLHGNKFIGEILELAIAQFVYINESE